MKSEQEEEQWTEVIHWGVETVKANDEAMPLTIHLSVQVWYIVLLPAAVELLVVSQVVVFSLSAADQLHHIPHSVLVGSEA